MMTIDYNKYAQVAVSVLDEIMSEKTGEDLQIVFNLGEEAFNKAVEAGKLVARMIERWITDQEENTESRDISQEKDEVLERALEKFNQ